jgi:glycosyltransferase involved in cell wall biosynthesis
MAGVKPRLCVLIPSHWAGKRGGAELQVRMLVERLVSLDTFEVHLVARNIDPHHVPAGYTLHEIPPYKAVAGTFLLDVPSLWRLLRRLQPQVIYQRVAGAYTGTAAYYARRHHCRMVWHVSHDQDLMPIPWRWSLRSPVEQLDRRLIDYGARRADAIIVQNSAQAELLRRNYGRSDAVHISNFHSAPAAPPTKALDRLMVCWIANFKPTKQPEFFLRLAADLRNRSNVEFHMAGALQMKRKASERLLARMRKLPNLQYSGFQADDAIDKLLSTAHVLVNTSYAEGFPNTFIEAWLREVPVVSLSVNPDGVFDEDRFGICAHGSYEQLRDAVERLIVNTTLRSQMGQRAAVFARERFSDRNIEQVIQVLSRQN